jgi:hypothetical protein
MRGAGTVTRGREVVVRQAFGDLIVQGRAGAGRWLCRCECGRTTRVLTRNLLSGNTRSCGEHRPYSADDSGMAAYKAAHTRVAQVRGTARQYRCANCGEAQAEEWAFDWEHTPEARRRVTTHDYGFSSDPADYLPLCVQCHRRTDPHAKAQRIAYEHGARPLWEPLEDQHG